MTKSDVHGATQHKAVLYLEHTHHAILLDSVLTGLTGEGDIILSCSATTQTGQLGRQQQQQRFIHFKHFKHSYIESD